MISILILWNNNISLKHPLQIARLISKRASSLLSMCALGSWVGMLQFCLSRRSLVCDQVFMFSVLLLCGNMLNFGCAQQKDPTYLKMLKNIVFLSMAVFTLWEQSLNHRIIGLLGLEKTLNITESNCNLTILL